MTAAEEEEFSSELNVFSATQIVQEDNLSLFVTQTHVPKHTVVAEFYTLLLVQSQDKHSMQYKYSSYCDRMWGDLLVKRVLVDFAGANQTLRQ